MMTDLRTIWVWAPHRMGIAAFATLFMTSCSLSPAQAQGVRGVWSDLIRGTAKVADNAPVKQVDDFVAELSKSRAARDAVDTELRQVGRLAENAVVVRGAARSKEVLRMLRSATSGIDPNVMRRIEKLDDASRDAALVLARGGDELSTALPDIASRGRLLREGGAATVAAVGMFGPDAARAALRLDAAIRGGSVVVKQGSRAVTVADFGSTMTRYGDASWRFWKGYVQPHWKVWAASGALAAYLTNPEYFQDETGKLTAAGFRHLTELVGEVAASAIRGVGQGSANATEKVAIAARETFLNWKSGIYAVIGTLAFIGCLSLAFRRIRSWLLRPFRWLNQPPQGANTSNS